MIAMLTKQQIAWATAHEWYVSDNGDGTIIVVDRWWDRVTGERGEELITMSDFQELRAWAGY